MKKFVISTLVLFIVASCVKDQTTTANTTDSQKDPNEVSLVQKPIKLKNSQGEEISVTYFANGEEVAVKIERNGIPADELTAKTISAKGDPVFTNEKWMWEGAIGKGGKLSDGEGNSTEYFEVEE